MSRRLKEHSRRIYGNRVEIVAQTDKNLKQIVNLLHVARENAGQRASVGNLVRIVLFYSLVRWQKFFNVRLVLVFLSSHDVKQAVLLDRTVR